jgi:DNA-binding transcriptional LysR family regulator
MEASSPESLKGLVATGLGFTIMSRAAVAKEARLGELVPIPLAPRLIRNLSVVYPKERIHSRLINAFIAFARARLAAASPGDADRAATG